MAGVVNDCRSCGITIWDDETIHGLCDRCKGNQVQFNQANHNAGNVVNAAHDPVLSLTAEQIRDKIRRAGWEIMEVCDTPGVWAPDRITLTRGNEQVKVHRGRKECYASVLGRAFRAAIAIAGEPQ